jgi:hypothetical protein
MLIRKTLGRTKIYFVIQYLGRNKQKQTKKYQAEKEGICLAVNARIVFVVQRCKSQRIKIHRPTCRFSIGF